MQIIKKKKIYNGYIELRDYELTNFLTIGEPVKIYYKEQYMILTPEDLQKGKVINTQRSKFNADQIYRIYGWKWNPKTA